MIEKFKKPRKAITEYAIVTGAFGAALLVLNPGVFIPVLTILDLCAAFYALSYSFKNM